MSVAFTWATTTEERALDFACDRHLAADAAYYRGATVMAPATTVFR